jgi:hypothetical protein
MRLPPWSLAATILLALAAPAAADPLIGFTDNTVDTASAAGLSDTESNWAVGWTQTVATTNVTVRALLDITTSVAPGATGAWYITTALGPGATPADVVASGIYTPPELGGGASYFDFNPLARTTLASGLSFAAGSYFLVLDGPAGPFVSNANWIGGIGPADTAQLAPGFSLGSTYHAASGIPGAAPADFAPASPFFIVPGSAFSVFELDGKVAATAPEPGTWALLIAGLGLAGAGLRRRRYVRA